MATLDRIANSVPNGGEAGENPECPSFHSSLPPEMSCVRSHDGKHWPSQAAGSLSSPAMNGREFLPLVHSSNAEGSVHKAIQYAWHPTTAGSVLLVAVHF